MSIETPLSQVESLLDYLITAEVVDNTFGTIWQIHGGLDRIDAQMSDAGSLPTEMLDRL